METKGIPVNSATESALASVYKRSFSNDIRNCKKTVLMPLIGYARVSTEDQTPLPQSQALKSAGCAEIHEEQASGGNRARPVLARVLERIGEGDTLVVVRIDRLARSLSHLLEVIERLEAKGAFFRSLTDPIDTSSPSVASKMRHSSRVDPASTGIAGMARVRATTKGCSMMTSPSRQGWNGPWGGTNPGSIPPCAAIVAAFCRASQKSPLASPQMAPPIHGDGP
mgnify:CR=1 FL=1